MNKRLLLASLASCALVGAGCGDSVLTPQDLDLTFPYSDTRLVEWDRTAD